MDFVHAILKKAIVNKYCRYYIMNLMANFKTALSKSNTINLIIQILQPFKIFCKSCNF